MELCKSTLYPFLSKLIRRHFYSALVCECFFEDNVFVFVARNSIEKQQPRFFFTKAEKMR